jgi:hypothetical protein
MEFLDYCTWFDARPAEVAVLSTFNFDPAFFEYRLLQRSKSLASARRVLVLMDAGQFRLLLSEGRPARWLNRRYLIVPIEKPAGVFHPKLHLLVGPTGADVICGSNNLTASGCTGNLELANRIPVPVEDGRPALATAHVARKAYHFFVRCLAYAVSDARKLAAKWLDELKHQFEWLGDDTVGDSVPDVDLVHTLEDGDWPALAMLANGKSPARLVIISPFYDRDLAMLRRVRNQWPTCRVEIHAQDGHSNLPADQLPDTCPDAELFDLECDNRRLHAKLFAWKVGESVECLVGNANFTTPAWDRRNVEACLRLRKVGRQIDKLFDNGVQRRKILPGEFTPGREEPPTPAPGEAEDRPRVTSACLKSDNVLHVHYVNPLHPKTEGLLLELWDWRGKDPVTSDRVRSQAVGDVTVVVKPETLAGCHGALTVSLTALLHEERRVGIPCWVIQEDRLTRQAAGQVRDMLRRQIEETGEGLTTHLDELLRDAKIDEVIEYLRRLHIRFDDGVSQRAGQVFRRYAHDPFRPDAPADWLARIPGARRQDLWEAIQEFADRHEKNCLRRHSRRGNLNGMRNFLDVFVTLCGLLWHYYKLQLVPEPWQGPRLIGRVCRYLYLATLGLTDYPGYLATLMENLKGDPERVRRACAEWNFTGHLRAALLIAQRVRWEAPDMQGVPSPLRCLPTDVKDLASGLALIRAVPVSADEMRAAFQRYEFTDAERQEWHQIALGHAPHRISQAKLWRSPYPDK